MRMSPAPRIDRHCRGSNVLACRHSRRIASKARDDRDKRCWLSRLTSEFPLPSLVELWTKSSYFRISGADLATACDAIGVQDTGALLLCIGEGKTAAP